MNRRDDKPPRLARWIFERSLHEVHSDEVLGDLEETFARMRENDGSRWARLWYWGQLSRSFPLFLLATVYWGTVMLKNQLKTVLRTLRSQKVYAILNITGLSVGIALSILALLYVQHEYSFDRSLSKADRIYRVVQHINLPFEAPSAKATTGEGLAETLLENFPEISQVTRISSGREYTLQYGDKLFKVKNWYSVDPSVFELFDIEIILGSVKKPFPDPASFVISESEARKIFGDVDPIGKTITLTGPHLESWDKTVTAVARDLPVNSHFQFDYLEGINPSPEGGWIGGEGYFTYIVLPEDYVPGQLEEKFPAFVEVFIGPEVDGYSKRSLEELNKLGYSWTLRLQSLRDVHLDAQYLGALGRRGSRTTINFFSLIAFFILVLACVNFMNLATARSSRRLKEVGVRKVVGSSRSQLVHQFLLESIVVSMLSLVVACALVALLLPAFNEYLGTEITFNLLGSAYLLPGLIILAVAVGVLAGSYPAFFLSGLRPVDLLSGARRSERGVSLRDGLVVFQFLITVLLILATRVVYSQITFMQNKDLGVNSEQLLVLPDVASSFFRAEAASYRGLLATLGYSFADWISLSDQRRTEIIEGSDGALDGYIDMTARRTRLFKQRLLETPGVQSVTITGGVPGREMGRPIRIRPKGASEESEVYINWIATDADFLETLQLELIAGRNVSDDDGDLGSWLINETAAELFGADSPLGSTLADQLIQLAEDGYRPYGEFESPIVGVVKDFQYADMRTELQPVVIAPFIGIGPHILVRLHSGDLQTTITAIERTWSDFIPDEPLNYSFFDDDFARLFEADMRLGKAFGFFATLAIIIASLGLFGLAAFMAEQRTKEIGIRKTLGASVQNIVLLLSRHFVWLLLIGNLLAWPIGYVAMNRWLDDFAFRIDIGVGIFILTGAATLVLVVISVGGQALRASLANPVDSLRYE